MTEIEKLYENAGIKECNRLLPCPFKNECEEGCEYHWYPEFTEEKQIELIKWIAENKEECRITYEKEYKWCTQTDWQSSFCYDNFPASLANLINDLWQSLTGQEKEEIRNILND